MAFFPAQNPKPKNSKKELQRIQEMENSGKPSFNKKKKKKKSKKSKFFKRKQGLKKKIEELSILCGVEALLVYFDDDDGSFSWPEDRQTCLSLIERYRSYNEEQRKERSVDLSSFLNEKIEKLRADLSKENQKNKEIEMGNEIIEGLGFDQLQQILSEVKSTKKAVEDRIRFLKMTELRLGFSQDFI